MRINDRTGQFSEPEKQELWNFIGQKLLSTKTDLAFLARLIIREDVRSGYKGYWRLKTKSDYPNPQYAAIIVLNYYYVKFFDRQKQLEKLKITLAHEYGHHWTLFHLLVRQEIDINFFECRLPELYYRLRELSEDTVACNYSQGWHKCDKEVIAEDYRVFFAPDPYNNHHRMVEGYQKYLALPSDRVSVYIRNLGVDRGNLK